MTDSDGRHLKEIGTDGEYTGGYLDLVVEEHYSSECTYDVKWYVKSPFEMKQQFWHMEWHHALLFSSMSTSKVLGTMGIIFYFQWRTYVDLTHYFSQLNSAFLFIHTSRFVLDEIPPLIRCNKLWNIILTFYFYLWYASEKLWVGGWLKKLILFMNVTG